jgi:hypothetical protein
VVQLLNLQEAFAAWEKAGFLMFPVPGTNLVRLRRADDAVDLLIIKERTLVEVIHKCGRAPEQLHAFVNTRVKARRPSAF